MKTQNLHTFYERRLAEMLRGELSKGQQELLLDHVHLCEACQKTWDEHVLALVAAADDDGACVPASEGTDVAGPESAGQSAPVEFAPMKKGPTRLGHAAASPAYPRDPLSPGMRPGRHPSPAPRFRSAVYRRPGLIAAAALLCLVPLVRYARVHWGSRNLPPSSPMAVSSEGGSTRSEAAPASEPAPSVAPAPPTEHQPSPEQLAAQHALQVALQDGGKRTVSVRLSYAPAAAHRPYQALMSQQQQRTDLPLSLLSALEQAQDWHGVSVGHLLRGELDSARAVLAKVAPKASVDVAADAAALEILLAEHDGEGRAARQEAVLSQLDDLLSRHPRHAPTLWNRALLLRERGLTASAAAAFASVAALGEKGWSEEAGAAAAALRQEFEKEKQRWQQFNEQAEAMVSGGPALPAGLARRYAGSARAFFYDAVFAADSASRVRALGPLAAVLDEGLGSSVLANYVERISRSNFAVRAPLARRYTAFRRDPGSLPVAQQGALLNDLRAAKQGDLLLGAIRLAGAYRSHAAEYAALARASHDPWFETLNAQLAIQSAYESGAIDRAAALIEAPLDHCLKLRLPYRCAYLLLQRAQLAVLQHRPGARPDLRTAVQLAQEINDWQFVSSLLFQFGDFAYYRSDYSTARAYLDEWLQRESGPCEIVRAIRERFAMFALREGDYSGAQATLNSAPSCGTAGLAGAMVSVVVWEKDGLARSAQQAGGILRSLRQQDHGLAPSEKLLLQHLEARMLLADSREEGAQTLRRLIQQSATLPPTDEDAQKVRGYSYAALIHDAVQHADYSDALALWAEEAHRPLPARCVLGITQDDSRLSVVARDHLGQDQGSYSAEVSPSALAQPARLIPAPVLAALSGCGHVQVFARTALEGRSQLLPIDLAWSYSAARSPASPAAAARPTHRLIVADVDTPLQLARLPMWSESKPGQRPGQLAVTFLHGAGATPEAVLQALPGAGEIELHVHGGSFDADLDTAQLALAGTTRASSLLDARQIARTTLDGHPVVILVSCSTATTSRLWHKSWSLPSAFIRAGARAVFASTHPVPYPQGGTFFAEIHTMMQEGMPAHLALQNVRRTWLARHEDWVRSVVLFE